MDVPYSSWLRKIGKGIYWTTPAIISIAADIACYNSTGNHQPAIAMFTAVVYSLM